MALSYGAFFIALETENIVQTGFIAALQNEGIVILGEDPKMKRSLMMFSAVAAFVVPAVTPMAVLAQDRGEARQDGPRRDRGSEQRSRPTENRSQGRTEPRPSARPEARPDTRPENVQRPNRAPERQQDNRPARPAEQSEQRPAQQRPQQATPQQRPQAQRPTQNPSREPNRPQERPQARPDGRLNQATPRPNQPSARPNDSRRPQAGRPNDTRVDRRPDNDRRVTRSDNRGPDRRIDRERRERDFRRNWNHDQWRRDFNRSHRGDWWRNDNRFRGWSGVRVGFYFAPGYGYYSVPRSYWNRQWQAGQYLPDVFWRYQVNDYRTYGLGYPPPGTRWVYVDNAIYLIDDYDGYIIEAIRDAWRW